MAARTALHELVASSPVAMEAYWLFNPRGRRFAGHYNVERLHAALPPAVAETRPFVESAPRGKKIFIFATLHYWIEQAAFMGLALAGRGHRVTLGYLPYASWQKEIPLFDLRRQALRTRDLLKPAAGLVDAVNLLDERPATSLPPELLAQIQRVSAYDVMYTRQVEDIGGEDALFHLRLERNEFAARAALARLTADRPDVVLIPNGTILELGAVYRAARHLGLETNTYEFNDQREQIWLAENDEIMRQNTDALWAATGAKPLTGEQESIIHTFESARMGARLEGKAARQWQDVPAGSSDPLRVRAELGLDGRPVVLLATNVLGDSLTLGRNVFSQSMAEWIRRTVQYFAARRNTQLVVRIHPGERLTHGPSMMDVVREAASPLPEHIHMVGPLDKVNTYDLMGCASLGLVFTTTAGLEMALHGLPVITAGQTHYRGRGFTLDPASWEQYFTLLDRLLANPAPLTPAQVDLAWRYAYHFFYSYPEPFPWRLISFWKDLTTWPLKRVLGAEGQAEFGGTFARLAGQPVLIDE